MENTENKTVKETSKEVNETPKPLFEDLNGHKHGKS